MTLERVARTQGSHSLRVRSIIAAAFILPAVPGSPFAQTGDGSLVLRVERSRAIVRYYPGSERAEVVYRTGRWIRTLRVAPHGQYIAFSERSEPEPDAPFRLVVTDPRGRKLRVVQRDARVLEWCCAADKIAVITGTTLEESARGFRPEAVYVIDVNSGREEKLTGAAVALHWAEFDSSLYIHTGAYQEARVYRYHAPTGTLSPTSRKGIQFSPDGKYYLDRRMEAAPRYYSASADREITSRLPEILQDLFYVRWLPGQDHLLVFVRRTFPGGAPDTSWFPGAPGAPTTDWIHYVVNPETGHVVDIFVITDSAGRGAPPWHGWESNAEALPVRVDSSIRLLRPLEGK